MDVSFHIPTSKSNTQFVGDENRPPAQPSVDSTVDPYLDDIKNQAGDDESDGEDEDFVAEKDDSRFPTDDSDEEHSDASGSGGEKKEKMPKKEATVSKPSSSKRKAKDGDEAGSKKRPKKKKDPNAPKRGMSGVMFFSNAERENIKKSNPGLAFPEVGKALGEKWKKMSAEEKEPFETMAKADKKRYREQMAGYKSGTAATVNSGNDAS